jgi:hypothetical protein
MIVLRKILTLIVSILLLAGTTGFTVVQHQCIHCGTDYKVLFTDDNNYKEASCSVPIDSDCCSDGEVPAKEHSISPGDEECCAYFYSTGKISDPVKNFYINYETAFLLPEALFVLSSDPFSVEAVPLIYSYRIKPPGSKLLIQISCFLT